MTTRTKNIEKKFNSKNEIILKNNIYKILNKNLQKIKQANI